MLSAAHKRADLEKALETLSRIGKDMQII